ncbi:orexin receptor type 2 [Patella vulgata]|uniref:orexin receptor type 2 n=1 Tax=Patella vulgata TaxID=6465 RepID=UPI00217FBDFE|nr:orexin receptor type 2 [Patella vulgata]XP_050415345.1 orexin receptor type 2 [Patella vulgata]
MDNTTVAVGTFLNSVPSELQIHSDIKAVLLIPVVVVCALCMVVGVIGSSLVCFICGLRLRKNVTNTFVLALASVDLVSCVVCIPLEILELRLPYMFDFPVLCKILRTLRSVTTITSGLILVAIAIERYNRICKPLNKHIHVSQANRACIAVLICGIICSCPAAVLFGKQKIDLGIDEVGVECSMDDQLLETFYPSAYYIFLFLLYFSTSLALCILYSLIAAKIWKRRKVLTNVRNRSPSIPESVICDTKSVSSGDYTSHAKIVEQVAMNIQKGKFATLTRSPSTLKRRRVYSRKRTTCIMFFMTLTFIVSCLPYILISICRTIIESFESNLTNTEAVFFELGLKTYIISSAVNPYIYGFSNGQFKQECYKLIIGVFCKTKSITRQNTTNNNSAKMAVRINTGESEA